MTGALLTANCKLRHRLDCLTPPPNESDSLPPPLPVARAALRQRLQELRRRVECLTAELQEAREELERETAECHRREDRGDDVEEAQDEREIEREREREYCLGKL